MEKIVITGNRPLMGNIEVSGMKNSAVAILFGTILTGGKCVIENLPDISDVTDCLMILEGMGATVNKKSKSSYEIDTSNVVQGSAPYNLIRKMRASYYILGAELSRFGKARCAYPGGCDFGVRPIDQHIKGFEALGAQVKTVEGGFIECDTKENGGLLANAIFMDVVSVGATINVMLAATMAKGMTIIENAAREPHVVDLANFLNSAGADISGAGTNVIKIRGVSKMHGVSYAIVPDMIEAGTYMCAAAATHGDLLIQNVIPKHLDSVSAKLEEMGALVEEFDDSVRVSLSPDKRLIKANVKTLPYPGFPTDMNPQIGVLLAIAEGPGSLTEGVWENRFRYTDELNLMGADIKVNGRMAVFQGVENLNGARVKAVDLRAGAAMIIAGLCAKGVTYIEEISHIQRGYEDIVGKLRMVGADIKLCDCADEGSAE